MIDWDTIARKEGYKDARSFFQAHYIIYKESAKQIGDKFKCSRITVLNAIRKCGVQVKGRGGLHGKEFNK